MNLNEELDQIEEILGSSEDWLRFRCEVLDIDRKRVIAQSMVESHRSKIRHLQYQVAQLKNQIALGDLWEAELREVLDLPPAHTPGVSIINAVKYLIVKARYNL